MRLFIIFISSLIIFLTSAKASDVDKKLHKDCLYTTIYVGKADKSSFGSGVIVRSDKVKENLYKNVFITCAHLVEQNYLDYEVKQYIYEDWSFLKEIKSYPAIFQAANFDWDLAVGVFYSKEEMPVAKLDFDPKIYIGSDIFRIGCGLGDDPRLDFGKLTWYKKGLPKHYFRTSILTVPGDSGSPVFYDYKVIGIMVTIRTFRNLPVFNISYAVPLDRFKERSKLNKNDLDFIWNKADLPCLPFYYLEFKNYEITK